MGTMQVSPAATSISVPRLFTVGRDALTTRHIESLEERSFRQEIRAESYEWIWSYWIERAGDVGHDVFNELAKVIITKGYDVPGYTPY